MENSIEALRSQNGAMPVKFDKLGPSLTTDNATFAPFILIEGDCRALVMFDYSMTLKSPIFLERSTEGWTGNGCDWTLLAEIVTAECLCPLTEPVTFDSDADLFSARGCRLTLEKLAFQLQAIYCNDDAIRDLMSRVIVASNVTPIKSEPQELTRALSYQDRSAL